MLTQIKLKNQLHYNPNTGIFTRLIRTTNSVNINDIAGSFDKLDGYVRIMVIGKSFKAHRLAWLYIYGEFPKNEVDHINGIRNDNRLCNLREATNAQNQQNQRNPHSNNKLGYLGVRFHKVTGKYMSEISINGKYKYLGIFISPQEAHDAYLLAKKEFHKFCTI